MAGSSHAQSPTATTIRGRIVADDTGDAIRNARVSLSDTLAAPVAFTDADGRFALAPVAPDPRDLVAAKTGYVKTSARRPTACKFG